MHVHSKFSPSVLVISMRYHCCRHRDLIKIRRSRKTIMILCSAGTVNNLFGFSTHARLSVATFGSNVTFPDLNFSGQTLLITLFCVSAVFPETPRTNAYTVHVFPDPYTLGSLIDFNELKRTTRRIFDTTKGIQSVSLRM